MVAEGAAHDRFCSMQYELAFKLKMAGFPQGGAGRWTYPPDKLVGRPRDRVYVPSLSELIAACATDHVRLESDGDLPAATRWYAQDQISMNIGLGSTPEEAVARLWLALQKNEHRSMPGSTS